MIIAMFVVLSRLLQDQIFLRRKVKTGKHAGKHDTCLPQRFSPEQNKSENYHQHDIDMTGDTSRDSFFQFSGGNDSHILQDGKQPVPQTPENKCPVRPVPQTGGQKDDEFVEVRPQLAAVTASERDIKIVPEPGGQGDMPPSPEFLDRRGGIRIIEIFQEPEPEDPSHTDGHVAVPAEVKIDLQRIAYSAEPGDPGVQISAVQCEHLIRSRRPPYLR